MELVIRRARPADKRGVREAVRTIWNGGDRVPALFDSWVTHRTGPFFVAELGGRVVGIGKLTRITAREAWLEGGRVAPRYRRRGIATALIAHRIAYARERGYAVIRFSTASDNTPIHKAARHFGFRRVAELWRHEAPAAPGSPPARARARDARALRRLLAPYLQIRVSWEWRDLTLADVRSAIRRGRVFVVGRPVAAAAIVGTATDPQDALPIVAIGGRGAALVELLLGLRALAARRRLPGVSFYVADRGQRAAAKRAGFKPPWPGKALLFERRL
jgi:RimJ/RimL family protein N-acetyltransferase